MSATLRLVNGTAATTAQATFIFNAANDTLFWDPDGTGAAAALAIVKLTNVASLSAANFDLWT
jgi:Ca2+-binding RTX toxin-like protein